METLGYLYCAVGYEDPAIDNRLGDGDRSSSPRLNPAGTVRHASFQVLTLLYSLSMILGGAGHALAMGDGDRSGEVSQLQTDLAAAGYYSGPVTGYYDDLTRSAVIQFQQTNGLVVDGVVGPDTLVALRQHGSNRYPYTSTQYYYVPTQTYPQTYPASMLPSATVLRPGDSGEGVIRLQQRLRSAGFYDGHVTGYYGPLTEEAVIRFQRANGLVPDGIVGATTLAALNADLRPQPRPVVYQPTVEVYSYETVSVEPTAPILRPVVQPAPLPSPPIVLGDVLYRGDRGPAVEALQVALTRAGYYRGPITGYYGSLTAEAVEDFQDANDLTINGIAGPTTLAALQEPPEDA